MTNDTIETDRDEVCAHCGADVTVDRYINRRTITFDCPACEEANEYEDEIDPDLWRKARMEDAAWA